TQIFVSFVSPVLSARKNAHICSCICAFKFRGASRLCGENYCGATLDYRLATESRRDAARRAGSTKSNSGSALGSMDFRRLALCQVVTCAPEIASGRDVLRREFQLERHCQTQVKNPGMVGPSGTNPR